MLVQVVFLERRPQRLIHLQQDAKAWRFLAAAVAQPLANGLIFLGRHDLQQRDLRVISRCAVARGETA